MLRLFRTRFWHWKTTFCNGRCGRKHLRARTTHYNCPSLSLRRCPPKRSELRQEPKRGLSTLVGREAVGQGEGGFSPAAMTILHSVGSLGTGRAHAWTHDLSLPGTQPRTATHQRRAFSPGFTRAVGKKPMNYSLTLLNHYYYWNALADGQSRLLGRTSVN